VCGSAGRGHAGVGKVAVRALAGCMSAIVSLVDASCRFGCYCVVAAGSVRVGLSAAVGCRQG
jgi:hypothetical protein